LARSAKNTGSGALLGHGSDVIAIAAPIASHLVVSPGINAVPSRQTEGARGFKAQVCSRDEVDDTLTSNDRQAPLSAP
jgi:hypothetical protein